MPTTSDLEEIREVLDWVEAKTNSIWPNSVKSSPNRVDTMTLAMRLDTHEMALELKDTELAESLLSEQRFEELNWGVDDPDIVLFGGKVASRIAYRFARMGRGEEGNFSESELQEYADKAANLTDRFSKLLFEQDGWSKDEKLQAYRQCGKLYGVGAYALNRADNKRANDFLEKIIKLAKEQHNVAELIDALTYAVDVAIESRFRPGEEEKGLDAFQVWKLVYDVIKSEPESDVTWRVGVVYTLGFLQYHLGEQIREQIRTSPDRQGSNAAEILDAQETAFQLMRQRFFEWDDKCWRDDNAGIAAYQILLALNERLGRKAAEEDSLFSLDYSLPPMDDDDLELFRTVAFDPRVEVLAYAIDFGWMWNRLTSKLAIEDHEKIFDTCVKQLEKALANYPIKDDRDRFVVKLLMHGTRVTAEKTGENIVKRLWTETSPVIHPFVQNGLPIEISKLPLEQWNESCIETHAQSSLEFYKEVSSVITLQARPRMANAFAAIASAAITFDRQDIAAWLVDELGEFNETTHDIWCSIVSVAVVGAGPRDLNRVVNWAKHAEQTSLSQSYNAFDAQAAVSAYCAIAQEIAKAEPELADTLLSRIEKLLDDIYKQISERDGDAA